MTKTSSYFRLPPSARALGVGRWRARPRLTRRALAFQLLAAAAPLAFDANGDLVQLVGRRPDAIADVVEKLLHDQDAAAAMARRGHALVEARTWKRAGDRVESALREFLADPRLRSG